MVGNVPPVVMVRVESSLLAEVGYRQENDLEQTGTLFVRFHPSKKCPAGSGPLWGYAGVPLHKHVSLMGAASPGKYFIANIRDLKDGSGILIHKATHWS